MPSEELLQLPGMVAGCKGRENGEGYLEYPCGMQATHEAEVGLGYVLSDLHQRHHELHPDFHGDSWVIIARRESGMRPDGYYRVVDTYWCSHEEGPR